MRETVKEKNSDEEDICVLTGVAESTAVSLSASVMQLSHGSHPGDSTANGVKAVSVHVSPTLMQQKNKTILSSFHVRLFYFFI